jgi:hypothetical protein
MADALPPSGLDRAAAGFRDLALKRHAYYLELLRSGRWEHYFSRQEFALRLRDVARSTVDWRRHAGAVDSGAPGAIWDRRSAA